MKFSEIETQLRKYIENQENSAHSIVVDNEAKEKTWGQVQGKMENPSRPKLIWTLVAASVAILMVATMGIHEIRKRDQTISRLQAELNSKKVSEQQLGLNIANLEKQLIDEQNKPAQIDTVFEARIVYRLSKHNNMAFVKNFPDPENLKNTEDEQNIAYGEKLPVFIGNQDEVESFEIEYGEKEKDGITPWTFTIQYNN